MTQWLLIGEKITKNLKMFMLGQVASAPWTVHFPSDMPRS